jgi:hypothetical protein
VDKVFLILHQASSDPVDGFPANATLTSQSGRGSNPSLPVAPASSLIHDSAKAEATF